MPKVEKLSETMNDQKSKSKNPRVNIAVSQVIEEAAAHVGLEVADFIYGAACREAQRIQAERSKTLLPREIFDAFLKVVHSDGEPNATLAALAKDKRQRLANE